MGVRYLGNLREAQGALRSLGEQWGALGNLGLHTRLDPPSLQNSFTSLARPFFSVMKPPLQKGQRPKP